MEGFKQKETYTIENIFDKLSELVVIYGDNDHFDNDIKNKRKKSSIEDFKWNIHNGENNINKDEILNDINKLRSIKLDLLTKIRNDESKSEKLSEIYNIVIILVNNIKERFPEINIPKDLLS